MTDPVMPGGWDVGGKGCACGSRKKVGGVVGWVPWVGSISWAHFCCERDNCHKKKIAIVPFLSLGLLPGTATHTILSEFQSLITPSTSEQSKTKPATTVLQVIPSATNLSSAADSPQRAFGEGATTRADCDSQVPSAATRCVCSRSLLCSG